MSASRRESVDAAGCEHATPIPAASRIGPFVAASLVAPFDVGSRSVPDGADAQVANVFERAGLVLGAAGLEWADVLRMTFHVADPSSREAIDRAWLVRFPDERHRPARMTLTAPLPDGVEVQGEFLAVAPAAADVEGGR